MTSIVFRQNFRLPISRSSSNNTGRLFEHIAVQFLRKKNYRIIEQNWRTKNGELDCIAATSDEKTIVVVEVKARAKDGNFSVRNAVDFRKRDQIYYMAQLYRSQNQSELGNKSFRFDVIRITFWKNDQYLFGILEHIEHALHHGFTLSFSEKKKVLRNRNSKYD